MKKENGVKGSRCPFPRGLPGPLHTRFSTSQGSAQQGCRMDRSQTSGRPGAGEHGRPAPAGPPGWGPRAAHLQAGASTCGPLCPEPALLRDEHTGRGKPHSLHSPRASRTASFHTVLKRTDSGPFQRVLHTISTQGVLQKSRVLQCMCESFITCLSDLGSESRVLISATLHLITYCHRARDMYTTWQVIPSPGLTGDFRISFLPCIISATSEHCCCKF